MTAQMPVHEPNFIIVPPDRATASVERLRRQALRLLAEDPSRTNREDAPLRSAAPEATAGQEDAPPSHRPASSMIVGIVTMPAVFLAVVFGALALFGKPGADTASVANPSGEALAQPASRRPVGPHLASSQALRPGAIQLADDWRVQSIALDGDRVALHVEGPAGREILVYDYRDGRLIGEAAIETVTTDAVDTLSMLTGHPPATTPAALPVLASAPVEGAASVPALLGASAPPLKPKSLP